MPTSDPLDILVGHNRWANRQILDRCLSLSEEEFHRNFDIGPGSLHDTMSHVIGAMLRWSDRIAGRTLRPSIEGRAPGDRAAPITRRSPEQLMALAEQAGDDFAEVVRSQRPHLVEVRNWTFGDRTYRFNVAAAIIHVTNHGMHHRAQCMNMLKRLGRPVNADLDELEWQIAGEP
ncbi:MAG: DinB family protein [Phycisphaerae bacterium]|nr:DinB family protein [Phycisphaerae bacterium]